MGRKDANLRGEHVYAAIRGAITSRRLRPGQRLREIELGELFGVSRTVTRTVLQRLANDGLVKIEANRGARVDLPSHEEIGELFKARATVEMGIVAQLCSTRPPQLIQRLREHIDREQAEIDSGNYRQAIALLGDFHIALAEAAQNEFLNSFYRSLVLRTSLIVSAFESASENTCRTDEHTELLDHIEAGDTASAVKCVWEHLNEIEDSLQVAAANGSEDYHPLRHLFGDERLPASSKLAPQNV